VKMELLNQCMSIRSDSYYCPLSFSIDAYWNCETKCTNCYLRRLNRTWGEDLKPANTLLLEETIKKGLESKVDSKNSLMQAIRQRKTIRFGNKSILIKRQMYNGK
jgi:DNA repair photolyase